MRPTPRYSRPAGRYRHKRGQHPGSPGRPDRRALASLEVTVAEPASSRAAATPAPQPRPGSAAAGPRLGVTHSLLLGALGALCLVLLLLAFAGLSGGAAGVARG